MLNRWIMNIVAIAIFATLIDMILIETHTKKYVGFFVGLVIIIIVLQPIYKFINSIPNLGDRVSAEVEQWNFEGKEMDGSGFENNKHIEELYKRNLEKDISQRIKSYLPDQSVWTTVTVKKGQDKDYFSLETIRISIGSQDTLGIEPVIIIPAGSEADNENIQGVNSELMEIIQKDLSRTYEIEESGIYIKIGS